MACKASNKELYLGGKQKRCCVILAQWSSNVSKDCIINNAKEASCALFSMNTGKMNTKNSVPINSKDVQNKLKFFGKIPCKAYPIKPAMVPTP